MGLLVLATVALAVGWVVSLAVHPFAPCRRCGGSGRNAGSTRKRFGMCKKCGGTGRRRRTGAKTVHRALLALMSRDREK